MEIAKRVPKTVHHVNRVVYTFGKPLPAGKRSGCQCKSKEHDASQLLIGNRSSHQANAQPSPLPN